MESVGNPKAYTTGLGESLCEETRCGKNLPILGIELGEASATQRRDLWQSALSGGHRDPLCLDNGLGIAQIGGLIGEGSLEEGAKHWAYAHTWHLKCLP